jgi:hypothetical protein
MTQSCVRANPSHGEEGGAADTEEPGQSRRAEDFKTEEDKSAGNEVTRTHEKESKDLDRLDEGDRDQEERRRPERSERGDAALDHANVKDLRERGEEGGKLVPAMAGRRGSARGSRTWMREQRAKWSRFSTVANYAPRRCRSSERSSSAYFAMA